MRNLINIDRSLDSLINFFEVGPQIGKIIIITMAQTLHLFHRPSYNYKLTFRIYLYVYIAYEASLIFPASDTTRRYFFSSNTITTITTVTVCD